MTLAALILLVVKASIVLSVLSVGLTASFQDATYLLRRPKLLVLSFVALFVVVPLVAVSFVIALDLHPPVEVAIVALAFSPVPPVFPGKVVKAKGETAYTISLLVVASVLSVIFIPIGAELLARTFDIARVGTVSTVAGIVLVSILVPLSVGIVIRRVAPEFAERIAKPLGLIAGIALLVCVVPILIAQASTIVSLIGNGTILAFIAFALVGTAAGHLLGGPDPNNRTVLGLAAASRHPGVAVAIAGTGFPDAKLVMPAVVLYILVSAVTTVPYVIWRKRSHVGAAEPLEN